MYAHEGLARHVRVLAISGGACEDAARVRGRGGGGCDDVCDGGDELGAGGDAAATAARRPRRGDPAGGPAGAVHRLL